MGEYVKRYNPQRSAEWNYGGAKWRLSRSKIEFFLECPRCFYIDNMLVIKPPSVPPFYPNNAVDLLLKREFDTFRKSQTAHPLMEKFSVPAVPFPHDNLDSWRDAFVGISYTHPETGLVVCGAVDDIWVNTDGSLAIVDYKATAKDGEIKSLTDSSWGAQYERQMGIYQWLFRKNGFTVSDTGYFVYCNGKLDGEGFNDCLLFDTNVIPCAGDLNWIEPTLFKIKECLESDHYPECGGNCEFCPYREAAGKALYNLYAKQKKAKSIV